MNSYSSCALIRVNPFELVSRRYLVIAVCGAIVVLITLGGRRWDTVVYVCRRTAFQVEKMNEDKEEWGKKTSV